MFYDVIPLYLVCSIVLRVRNKGDGYHIVADRSIAFTDVYNCIWLFSIVVHEREPMFNM